MKQLLRFFYVVIAGFFSVCLLSGEAALAQKENNVWYFGNGAGIDFNSGSPVALNNGALNTTEGCASIADTAGNLLFYTDGVTVFNKVHNIMVNGSGLFGGNSSSQSSIIVPMPGSSTMYYIFTTPDQGSIAGLNYSVVDMTLQGGFGEVVTLNTLLHSPIGEKVCATHHSNGSDYWIVAHEYNTDAFYAYHLSSAGVNPVPVISNVGLIHTGYHGYLKFTPDASKIGLAIGETNELELLDFDNSTGVVSNPINFPTTYIYPYGVEFSPDNSKFYIAQTGIGGPAGIYQFDLLAGSAAAIIASGQLVGITTNIYQGPLQLGPDGKIYCARYLTPYVGVIDNPNASGPACNYIDTAVFLGAGQSTFGLPNQIPHFDFVPVAIFSAPNHICPGTCTNFSNLSLNASSYLWTFPGANPGVSTDVNPVQICYNSPGQYSVTLIASNPNGSDTLFLPNYITVYPFPSPQGISQSGDTLFANQGSIAYQWYYNGSQIAGATGFYYVAMASGDYNVVCTDEYGCEVEAVIFNVIADLHDPGSFGFEGEGITIFPNPVEKELIIKNEEFKIGTATINIYNMLGALTAQPHPESYRDLNFKPQTSVDVSALAKGIYWIEIKVGEKTFRTKFIKSSNS